MAGRPCTRFEVNLNNLDESFEKIRLIYAHPKTRRNIITNFSKNLNKLCKSCDDKGTQSDIDGDGDTVLEDVLSLTDENMGYILRNIWQNLNNIG